jgi:hypothetical protein
MSLAVVCSPVAQAWASPRLTAFRPLSTEIVTAVATDGDRYAVAGLSNGLTRILDTRRGPSRDVSTPSCVNPVASAADLAPPLRSVGGGQVLWQCQTDTRQLIWVQDIATNRRFVAGGTAALWSAEAGGDTFRLISVGRHWLYAIRAGYHYTQDALISVDASRTIVGAAPRTIAAGAMGVRDAIALDRPHGTRPLCQGVTRAKGVIDAGIGELPYEPLMFDRPFAVSPYNDHPRPIQSCTGTRAAPSRTPVEYAQLGGRLLTWAERNAVHARTYTSRATATRTVKGTLASVSHTRNRVFVSVRSYPTRGYVAVLKR